MIPAVAVCGFQNSGKTTFCKEILSIMEKCGIKAGYIKHTHEDVLSECDTDSGGALAIAGEAALWGADGVRFDLRYSAKDFMPLIARFFPDKDIVIIEGGKYLNGLPKIWIDDGVKAPLDVAGIFMTYKRGQALEPVAQNLIKMLPEEALRSSRVWINDRAKPLPMKGFVADFIRYAVLGMLKSLKGTEDDKGWIQVNIKN